MLKLTQTVKKGGCAAKVAADDLRDILKQVKFPQKHSELLVDGSLFDDAAIYQIRHDLALVQTLDFFTPIVDTPYLFGKIAAANSLSDVYAMGGTPKTAMGILAFPLATLDQKTIIEVMQGASDTLAEASATFVGGHSIDDDTLKFGLSVTGYVHPEKIWSNEKAKAGDVLILTKPLGTGTFSAALKAQDISEEDMTPVLNSMSQINCVLDLLSSEEAEAIHSATDITGFGLLGHAMQMAKASEKTFHIDFSKLPIFEGTQAHLKNDCLTKAHRTNATYTAADCESTGIDAINKLILYDPQTSGGLFLSVDHKKAGDILKKLKRRFLSAEIVGQVALYSGKSVVVK